MSRDWGNEAARRLDELGAISDESSCLTRTFLSPGLESAKALVARWMAEARLEIFEDQAGNLIGRRSSEKTDAGTVVCGSHLDTVCNGGKFDGALGVVAGILAASQIEKPLPYHLEIVGFSDEEGVRFQTAYLGSRYYTGRLGQLERACKDRSGVSVEEAINAHTPAFPAPPSRGRLLGYIEAHIEQGPVLEMAGGALGVAIAIAGQTRARVTICGKAGHAGTTPMHLRRDALAGAAECITMIERLASESDGFVATVGELDISHAASNVIPGDVEFTVDIRNVSDELRGLFCEEIFSRIGERMKSRGLEIRVEVPTASSSVRCSRLLTDHLRKLVEARQGGCLDMTSGAGHDVVALAEVTEAALLFVRCRGGLSHHPDEFAAPGDIGAAVEVLKAMLANFPYE